MNEVPTPIIYGGFALAAALLPILFFLVTPFIKLSIVFGVLRTGFGSQGIPGTAALTALSIVLSLHLVEPVVSEISWLMPEISRSTKSKNESKFEYYERLFSLIANRSEPVRSFLLKNSGREELEFFSKRRGEVIQTASFAVIIPAFVLSELRTGFEMALLLFIPFFVLDILVTTILTGMGMMMVNPVTISFPLKLLLFVQCNGWMALSKSLLDQYGA